MLLSLRHRLEKGSVTPLGVLKLVRSPFVNGLPSALTKCLQIDYKYVSSVLKRLFSLHNRQLFDPCDLECRLKPSVKLSQRLHVRDLKATLKQFSGESQLLHSATAPAVTCHLHDPKVDIHEVRVSR